MRPLYIVIPDIHQNLVYADAILEVARSINPQKMIFLGDYFDRKSEHASTAKATCKWMIATADEFQEKVIFLIGNHDMDYLEHAAHSSRQSYAIGYVPDRKFGTYAFASGTAGDIHKYFNIRRESPWYENMKFVHDDGKYLFTHSGLTKNLHSGRPIILDSIIQDLQSTSPTGAARGMNSHQVNEAIWSRRFVTPYLHYTSRWQIFGHTIQEDGYKHIGKYVCIDGMQTTYAIIYQDKIDIFHINGNLIKSIDTTTNMETFYETIT